MRNYSLLVLGFISMIFPAVISAFSAPKVVSTTCSTRLSSSSSSRLNMVPRFDKEQNTWIPSTPEEGPSGGYDVIGTILRHGPIPFFNRIFKSDEYEQGVLKFMAIEKIDRDSAQAEMDAYLANPNDWAYNRLKGYDVDYLSIDRKQVTLTLVWATFILTLLGRGIYCATTGDYFWAIIGASPKAAWCEADNSCLLDTLNLR